MLVRSENYKQTWALSGLCLALWRSGCLKLDFLLITIHTSPEGVAHSAHCIGLAAIESENAFGGWPTANCGCSSSTASPRCTAVSMDDNWAVRLCCCRFYSTDSIYCLRNDNGKQHVKANCAAVSETHYADNAPSERSEKVKAGEKVKNVWESQKLRLFGCQWCRCTATQGGHHWSGTGKWLSRKKISARQLSYHPVKPHGLVKPKYLR